MRGDESLRQAWNTGRNHVADAETVRRCDRFWNWPEEANMKTRRRWCGTSCRDGAVALCVAAALVSSARGDQPLPPGTDLTVLAPWWTLHGANLTGVYAYPSGIGNGMGYVRTFGAGYGIGHSYGYGVGMGTPLWSNGYGSGGYYGMGSRPQPVWWTFPRAAANPAAVDALSKAQQVYGPQHGPEYAHRHCPICDGWRGLEYWDLNVPGHQPRWLPPQTHPHIVPFGGQDPGNDRPVNQAPAPHEQEKPLPEPPEANTTSDEAPL